jgi:hypothetical protein
VPDRGELILEVSNLLEWLVVGFGRFRLFLLPKLSATVAAVDEIVKQFFVSG